MAKGRKAKPIAQHIQDGTLRAYHIPDTPKDGTAQKIPIFPEHLPGECKDYWYLIVSELKSNNTLNDADAVLVESLCINVYIQNRAIEEIRNGEIVDNLIGAKGGEYKQRNPNVGVILDTQTNILKICAELGLSAAARTKIGVSKSDKKDVFKDDL